MATTFYVNQSRNDDTPGDGKSWETAFKDLQQALTSPQLKAGDEIWVAQGTYTPTTDRKDRTSSFVLIDGVGLYGGFKGGEESRKERSSNPALSVLSGKIDRYAVDNTGNSYHVVRGEGLSEKTVLDGFTICHGYAKSHDIHPTGLMPDYSGGGLILLSRWNKMCSPILRNLQFRYNFASAGGALYLDGRTTSCSPTLENINFIDNEALDWGGAMTIKAGYCQINPTLKDVKFRNNKAPYGGAMYILVFENEAQPTLTDVAFDNNHADRSGGAMMAWVRVGSNYSPNLNNVSFIKNDAKDDTGRAMYIIIDDDKCSYTPKLENVTYNGAATAKDGDVIETPLSSSILS